MKTQSTEKWISGIREVLSQLFILGAIGSLFVFVPLRSQSQTTEAPVSKQVEKVSQKGLAEGNTSDWDHFVSFLTRAE